MKLSDAGLELIQSFEGCSLTAYRDIVGVCTVGYGHTGKDVQMGQTIDQAEADRLLRQDVARFERCVSEAVTVEIDQRQFDACVCFAFNVGCGAFANSTLLKHLNNRDWLAAADQFLRWDRAGGKQVAGLTRRRKAERALFMETS